MIRTFYFTNTTGFGDETQFVELVVDKKLKASKTLWQYTIEKAGKRRLSLRIIPIQLLIALEFVDKGVWRHVSRKEVREFRKAHNFGKG